MTALSLLARRRIPRASAGRQYHPRNGDPMTDKAQLTEADVKRLYREGKADEIEQARLDGRLNDLLGITEEAAQ